VHDGSPDQIIETLSADAGVQAADELVLALPFDHPAPVVERVLTVFATEIAPALGWAPSSAARNGNRVTPSSNDSNR
jgi:hypothetical protein